MLVALLSPSGQATICLDGHESSNGAAKRLNRTGAAQSLSAAEMAAERERASVHTNIEELMQRLTAARLPGADANSSKLCATAACSVHCALSCPIIEYHCCTPFRGKRQGAPADKLHVFTVQYLWTLSSR